MKRRKFIKNFTLGSSALCATALNLSTVTSPKSAYANNNKKYRWRLTTTWPPKTAILQESAERFSKLVKKASYGRLSIKVFAGGELIPPLGVFDAVSQGNIELGIGTPYYWAGKSKAAQFFGAMPFGMNAQQFNAWMIAGGGQELWEEVYKPFNLIPFQFGNTGVQTAGWFKKKLTGPQDLKGLKIRAPGLGGKVLAKAGANVVLMPGSEVYTALERGTIDAAEWIGPYHDEKLGLHRAAKNCYYPGWQEPSANLELTVNAKAWGELPDDLKQIVSLAAADCNSWTLAMSEAKNGGALKILKDKYKVNVLPLPESILTTLKKHRDEVLNELASNDPVSKKILTSYQNFSKEISFWSEISEKAYSKFN